MHAVRVVSLPVWETSTNLLAVADDGDLSFRLGPKEPQQDDSAGMISGDERILFHFGVSMLREGQM